MSGATIFSNWNGFVATDPTPHVFLFVPEVEVGVIGAIGTAWLRLVDEKRFIKWTFLLFTIAQRLA